MNVTFIFSDYCLHNQIIENYAKVRPQDKISIVKVPLVIRGKGRRKTAEAILPKLPRRFILGKLVEFISLSLITLTPKLLKKGAVFRRLSSMAKRLNVPFKIVEDINSPESLEFIRSQTPEIIYSLFHQIVKAPLISIPTVAFVNAHPGLLPEFKGIQPYLWQLSTGHSNSGATLHLIEDAGVDTGRVLGQGSYPHPQKISVQLNYFLTCKVISSMLPKLTQYFEEQKVIPQPQKIDGEGKSNYYKWPDKDSIDNLSARGHRLIDLKQLWGILSGVYDDFSGEETFNLKE